MKKPQNDLKKKQFPVAFPFRMKEIFESWSQSQSSLPIYYCSDGSGVKISCQNTSLHGRPQIYSPVSQTIDLGRIRSSHRQARPNNFIVLVFSEQWSDAFRTMKLCFPNQNSRQKFEICRFSSQLRFLKSSLRMEFHVSPASPS